MCISKCVKNVFSLTLITKISAIYDGMYFPIDLYCKCIT